MVHQAIAPGESAALVLSMNINQPREPSGTAVGGRWTPVQHAEMEGVELSSPVQLRLPGVAHLVTDVLGRQLEVTHTYEDGAYDCPFCSYPVLSKEAGCRNPACPANPSRPSNEVAAQVAAAEARQAEDERRQREIEAATARFESWRQERKRRLVEVEAEARRRGACLTCLRRSSQESRPKFVKHRGKCPHER